MRVKGTGADRGLVLVALVAVVLVAVAVFFVLVLAPR
jgi:hypothetical protein